MVVNESLLHTNGTLPGKKELARRLLPNWQLKHGLVSLFNPQTVSIIRYR